MKKLILGCWVAVLGMGPLWAQEKGDFGLGVAVGNPTGATAKYWLSHYNALNFGIGSSGDMTLNVDFLGHGWKALPQPKQGKLVAHLGMGGRFEDKDKDDEFGIRGIAGLDYWFPNSSVELFFELAPVLRLTPDTDIQVDAGVGIRLYLKGFN